MPRRFLLALPLVLAAATCGGRSNLSLSGGGTLGTGNTGGGGSTATAHGGTGGTPTTTGTGGTPTTTGTGGTGFGGGVACSNPSGPCTGGLVCCGALKCNGGRCCEIDGDTCFADGDCCSGYCSPKRTCGPPGCGEIGAPCGSGDPPCCTGACSGGVCVSGTCAPDGTACAVDGDCCSGQCSGGTCGPPDPCPHDLCTVGAKLDPSCGGGCTGKLCAGADPFCCTTAWDQACVNAVINYCGKGCASCKGYDTPCNVPSDCCTNVCEGGRCAYPPCGTDGKPCAAGSTPCCSGTCNNGICGPQTCAPAGSACGPTTPTCCTGTCQNGVCSGPPVCKPDGAACASAAECCTAQCTAGICGASPCPTDGTLCGNCIQAKCCTQAATCLADPACATALHCELACVKAGGGPMQCFQQCGSDTQTLETALCIAGQCGGGACY